MPKTALDLFAAKAKLAGAVVLGGLVATAAVGGGAMSLVADSSATPIPVLASAEPTESPEATETPEATQSPEAKESEAPEAAKATQAATPDAAAEVVTVVLNHATVMSITATSLVVTAEGATTTWTLSPDTHFTGAITDPAQILPGMVIHLRGTDAGAALHVITPGRNKPHAEKKAHAKKTHAKKTHDKKSKAHRER